MSGLMVETFEAPAYWASALVNGDDSSFDISDERQAARDRRELAAWQRSIEPFYVVDVARDKHGEAAEPHFAHWQGLGRDVVAYTCHAPRNAVFFHLRRVRLNSGGYDSSGAYWGHGAPLYQWERWGADIGLESGTLRATDRKAAKAAVRKLYPFARFYN